MTFKLEAKEVTEAQALSSAKELEEFIGQVLSNYKKPKDLPLEPVARLIQFVRNIASSDSLPDAIEEALTETLDKINQEHPTHSRTSCSDEYLYNCGTILLPPRCSRCDALEKLRLYRIERKHEVFTLKRGG